MTVEQPKKEELTIYSYIDDPNSATLECALKNGAYEGLKKALKMERDAVTEEVKNSGLRGRGGAGFPAGIKWSFMPKEPTPEKPNYLVVNADEGEPGTFKDREIMNKVPHKLIEGIVIACYAMRSHRSYVYVRGEMYGAYAALQKAIKEATDAGYLGKNILGSGYDCDIILHRGAGAYICGEESALLDSLEGKRGHPRMRPPFPAQKGAFSMPTTVNNVETIAAVPWIIIHGADGYRKWGTEKSPGTKVFSVSGHVNNPGNYEVALGTPLRQIIEIAGGMKDGKAFKACFPGGSSCPLLGADFLDTPWDYESLMAAKSMLGSGGIIVMDEDTDLVRVMWRVAKFYAHESCGKCTPCFEGTWWMEKMLARILRGEGVPEDLKTLKDVADNIDGKSFCPLGEAAAWPVRSLVVRFPEEFDKYIPAVAGAKS
ncbi:MAG TPA: NADH-quinone oxidoreductase subunit NuoF [bacterium]|jgi:NADH-quinone oxidoreductase subunit F